MMKKNQTENPDTNAVLVAAMGKRLPDKTHFRSVINLYDEEVKMSNDRAGAYARRAIALCMGIHTGELDAADIEKCRSDVHEAQKINKDLTIVQIAEGCYYYYCMNDFDKAITSFQKASTLDPGGYKPLFYMAMVYKAMGKWKELISVLEKFGKFKIRNPLSLTNIGLCFDYLHDFDKALHYHQQAIEAKPDWPAAYMNKFYSLILKGKTAEARTVLNTLIKITDEEHIEYQLILDLYEGKFTDAFLKTEKAKPEDFSDKGERYLNLGNISLLLNDKMNADMYFDSALDELNPELIEQPGYAEIHFLAAQAHAGKGNKAQSVTLGEEAVRIAEKKNNKILESEMHTNMAKIYTITGMHDKALNEIEKVLVNPSLFSIKMLVMDPVWKPLTLRPELKAIIAKYDK